MIRDLSAVDPSAPATAWRAGTSSAVSNPEPSGGRGHDPRDHFHHLSRTPRPGLPRKPELLKIPDTRQAYDYTCGAAALHSVLAYYGVYDGGEAALAEELKTDPQWGTDPADMLRVARSYGLEGELRENMTFADLEQCLAEGIPVIVTYQAWRDPRFALPWEECWDDGHYSQVIGLDGDNVYLEDPSLLGELGYIPRDEFIRRWHDLDRSGHKLMMAGIVLRNPTGEKADLGKIVKIE